MHNIVPTAKNCMVQNVNTALQWKVQSFFRVYNDGSTQMQAEHSSNSLNMCSLLGRQLFKAGSTPSARIAGTVHSATKQPGGKKEWLLGMEWGKQLAWLDFLLLCFPVLKRLGSGMMYQLFPSSRPVQRDKLGSDRVRVHSPKASQPLTSRCQS